MFSTSSTQSKWRKPKIIELIVRGKKFIIQEKINQEIKPVAHRQISTVQTVQT